MKRRSGPLPPGHLRRRSTVSRRSSHTTVPPKPPPPVTKPPRPRIPPVAQTAAVHRAVAGAVLPRRRRKIGSIIDAEEATLLDVIDNLLNKGVVINADVILALANVDLVYLRLSTLLCAADRVLPGIEDRRQADAERRGTPPARPR